MPPNETIPKMSVDFDLTDIEDIDAISEEFDADPSSDDETFKSPRNASKRITKKRPKPFGASSKTANDNQTPSGNGNAVFPNGESRLPRADVRQVEQTQNSDSESETLVAAKPKEEQQPEFVMDQPTDMFNELERRMNGPGWMVTSSSATCSEDELGAFEKDEFSFKMCQIVRRPEPPPRPKKLASKTKSAPSPRASFLALEEVTPIKEESESSDDGNMLKFCSRAVPLAALNEDDL